MSNTSKQHDSPIESLDVYWFARWRRAIREGDRQTERDAADKLRRRGVIVNEVSTGAAS